MKVESETAGMRLPGSRARNAPGLREQTPVIAGSPAATSALALLSRGKGTRLAVCAPGRLEVMGGPGCLAGALVLNTALEGHVAVAVERRADHGLQIRLAPALGGQGAAIDFSPAQLDHPADARAVYQAIGDPTNSTGRAILAVAGTVAELIRAVRADTHLDGLTIAVDSTLEGRTDVGRDAALLAATVSAAALSHGLTLSLESATAICDRAARTWLDGLCHEADLSAALGSRPSSIMLCAQEGGAGHEAMPLPPGTCMFGIDSGVDSAEAACRVACVQATSQMGLTLIDAIIHHEGAGATRWDGRLSSITVSEYVTRFRDRLPTRLKGRDFLDRFGSSCDDVSQIDADRTYRVRSRTEHYIYEHDRSRRFVELLSEVQGSEDESRLTAAGEVMHASHWSYGQRCGLGCVATDLLVSLLRDAGPGNGIYGAKIGGRGCGGVVSVLMHDDRSAWSALEAALEKYERRARRKATVLTGTRPGALVGGVVCG